MQYVAKHLSKHHLFHAPHRWFFALLLSPFHVAEMHYKRRYHLTYSHAKILFFFDISLLSCIILLAIGGLSWYIYDPTVIEDIKLTLYPAIHDTTQSAERLQSGEHVEYIALYANNSGVRLDNPELIIQLPKTFVFETASPTETFNKSLFSFQLPPLPPGGSGQVKISGFFWGEPNKEEHVSARLAYRQETRNARETKITTIITTLRDSVIKTTIEAPDTIVSGSSLDARLLVKNTSHHPVHNVRLSVPATDGLRLTDITASTGSSTERFWTLATLAPGETASATLHLVLQGNGKESLPIVVQPDVVLPGITTLLLEPVQTLVAFVYPKVDMRASWENNAPLRPGETKNITFVLKNNGTVELADLRVQVDFPGNMVQKETVIFDSLGTASLRAFPPGKEISLTVPVHIRSFIGNGTDISLTPVVHVQGASFAGRFEPNAFSAAPIPIGTAISLQSTLRYYTNEGDQMGRGPLPPQVGKETKYGAFIRVTNGTSLVKNPRVATKLAPGFTFTGKKSLSSGKDITYDASARTITWTFSELPAHETGSLYFELAFTPTTGQVGTTPVAIESTMVQGEDAFIGGMVTATFGAVDIGLKEDALGKTKGTAVR